jgi:hypothetical protein
MSTVYLAMWLYIGSTIVNLVGLAVLAAVLAFQWLAARR